MIEGHAVLRRFAFPDVTSIPQLSSDAKTRFRKDNLHRGRSRHYEAVNENVGIAPPVQGVVTKGHVVVGDQVEVGTPLLQLDDRELRAQLETSEAAIASARVRWESRRALTLSTTQLPESTVRVA